LWTRPKALSSVTLILLSVTDEYHESGEKISSRTAVLILLSISFGVGYLYLPLTFFI